MKNYILTPKVIVTSPPEVYDAILSQDDKMKLLIKESGANKAPVFAEIKPLEGDELVLLQDTVFDMVFVQATDSMFQSLKSCISFDIIEDTELYFAM